MNVSDKYIINMLLIWMHIYVCKLMSWIESVCHDSPDTSSRPDKGPLWRIYSDDLEWSRYDLVPVVFREALQPRLTYDKTKIDHGGITCWKLGSALSRNTIQRTKYQILRVAKRPWQIFLIREKEIWGFQGSGFCWFRVTVVQLCHCAIGCLVICDPGRPPLINYEFASMVPLNNNTG